MESSEGVRSLAIHQKNWHAPFFIRCFDCHPLKTPLKAAIGAIRSTVLLRDRSRSTSVGAMLRAGAAGAIRPPETQVHSNSTFFLARKFWLTVRRRTKKISRRNRQGAENAEDIGLRSSVTESLLHFDGAREQDVVLQMNVMMKIALELLKRVE